MKAINYDINYEKLRPYHEDVYRMVFGLYGSRKEFLHALRVGSIDLTDPVVKKGMRAREILLDKHFGIVNKVIKKYIHLSTFDNIQQAGRLALLRAIESYKANMPIKFSTHATGIIRFELRQVGLEDRLIKLPSDALKLVNQVKRRTRSDNDDEILNICKELNYSRKEIGLVMMHYHKHLSLDTIVA